MSIFSILAALLLLLKETDVPEAGTVYLLLYLSCLGPDPPDPCLVFLREDFQAALQLPLFRLKFI